MNLLDGIVLSTFVPDRLRRLYRIPKRSREFELAFAEFYDDAKRGQIIDNLHGARLRKFVDFLDEVRGPSRYSGHCLIIWPGAAARRVR